MPVLGLIGYPLGHSFSPAYFQKKFDALGLSDWRYELFAMPDLSELESLIMNNPGLIAFNVTIPHKKSVLEYCQYKDKAVDAIGASNLVLIERLANTVRLHAYNTDYIGFETSLNRHLTRKPSRALILGTGGSSNAIQYALERKGIDCDKIGRKTELSYSSINLTNYNLIINCTPAGMFPTEHNGAILPLPYHQAQEGTVFFDLVYNPIKTEMMKEFESRGVKTINGLEMLHEQAEEAWRIICSFRA